MSIFDDEDERTQFCIAVVITILVLAMTVLPAFVLTARASGAPIDARAFEVMIVIGIALVLLGVAALVTVIIKWPRFGFVLLVLIAGFVVGTCARAQGHDLIFANGFGPADCPEENCSPGESPPPLCTPAPPDYPPDGLQYAGTQTFASLPEPSFDEFKQVKMRGGTWRAFSFTRPDMPGDVTAWNGDTSNTGGPPGADARLFNVSECEGDFRPLVPGCSGNVGEGPFLYANYTGVPLVAVEIKKDLTIFVPPEYAKGFWFAKRITATCLLDPAKTHFWNVHMGPAPCNSSGPNLCAFRVRLQ
jgi:hypothetical protein